MSGDIRELLGAAMDGVARSGAGDHLLTPAVRQRVRRRRSLHQATIGTVSVVAVAGLAFGGAALLDLQPPPSPVAGPSPTRTSPVPSPSVTAPAPSAPATPSPTTAAPTAQSAPPLLEGLVLSPEGLGPLLLGSRVPDVPAPGDMIVLDPLACEGTDSPSRWVAAYPAGVMANGAPGSAFTVGVLDGTVTRVAVQTPGPRTAGGIGVGSSIGEVHAAHPDLVQLAGDGGDLEFWMLRDGDRALVLEVAVDPPGLDWWGATAGTVVAMVATTGDPGSGSYYPGWGSDSCG